ncbi:MAG: AarF/ABC1/UbiB kinase family protein [Candidatus Aminicenantes bacterium]|nr:MAG: AarF/ABC1/UbiB kinase family protein [Candidatus Aminicenantes bacterium]
MVSLRRLHTVTRTYRHFHRYQQILMVLVKYGFGDILTKLHLYQVIERGFRFFRIRKETEIIRLLPYERIRLALEELGPTFVKLGQLLSTRPDLVPPTLVEELEELQDKVSPVPFVEVKKVIRTELGQPLEKIFSKFEEIPIAAASLGQVHCACLRNGDTVAVKVQRPNICRIIEVDLEIMLYLANLIQKHIVEAEAYDPVGIVKEFAKNIAKELDYTLESSNIERFAKNFKDVPLIYVPRVHHDYSTEKVLTMEYIDGIKTSEIKKLEAAGYDCKLIATRGAKLIAKQIFEHGFFHADPHPGNIFILPDNIVCFLDYGMMGRIDEEVKNDLASLMKAFIDKDVSETAHWFLKSYPSEKVDLREFKLDVWEILDQYHGLPLKQIELKRVFRQVLYLVEKHHLKIRPDLFLLNKALVYLEGMGSSLDPDFNAVEQIQPFIKEIILKKFSPRTIAHKWQKSLFEFFTLFQEFPQEIRNMFSLLKTGKMKVKFEHRGLEPFIAKQDQVSNRLAFAIIAAALIIGSALIVLSQTPPLVFGIPVIGLAGFLVAAFMGLWLLIAIFRSGKL